VDRSPIYSSATPSYVSICTVVPVSKYFCTSKASTFVPVEQVFIHTRTPAPLSARAASAFVLSY
jgi:hypothetical protein